MAESCNHECGAEEGGGGVSAFQASSPDAEISYG